MFGFWVKEHVGRCQVVTSYGQCLDVWPLVSDYCRTPPGVRHRKLLSESFIRLNHKYSLELES